MMPADKNKAIAEKSRRVLQRRYEFAKASLSIEGLRVTDEEDRFFQTMIAENRSAAEIEKALKVRFPGFDHAPVR